MTKKPKPPSDPRPEKTASVPVPLRERRNDSIEKALNNEIRTTNWGDAPTRPPKPER